VIVYIVMHKRHMINDLLSVASKSYNVKWYTDPIYCSLKFEEKWLGRNDDYCDANITYWAIQSYNSWQNFPHCVSLVHFRRQVKTSTVCHSWKACNVRILSICAMFSDICGNIEFRFRIFYSFDIFWNANNLSIFFSQFVLVLAMVLNQRWHHNK